MEREVLLTGIGGQGVQLAAKTLATAAISDGLNAMVFGIYTGSMRGERSESTVVISDGAITSPPTVSRAWYGIGLHHAFWLDTARKLRPGGLAIVDADVFRGDAGEVAVLVPATSVALAADAPKAAGMAALGALAAATQIVSLRSLRGATHHVLPGYRADHAARNERAVQAGFDAIAEPSTCAWSSGRDAEAS